MGALGNILLRFESFTGTTGQMGRKKLVEMSFFLLNSGEILLCLAGFDRVT